MSVTEKPYKTNRKLHGVVEYVLSNGGTIKQFNNYVITGKINDLNYRYFVSEHWITCFRDGNQGCFVMKPVYTNLKDFKDAVKLNSTKTIEHTIE